MTRDEIAQVQHFLNSQGASLKVDGLMGPQTMHMLERFQQVSGLKPDGIVGRQTQGAIDQTQNMPVPRDRPDMMLPVPQPNPMRDPGMQVMPPQGMGANPDPRMAMMPQGMGQNPDPGMAARPRPMDGDPTSTSSPDFARMIQAQLFARQSNADRNSQSQGMPPAFNTGAQLPPQPPMDGSSMSTANSGWAGGPMPSMPPGMAQQPSQMQQMDARQRLAAALLGRQ